MNFLSFSFRFFFLQSSCGKKTRAAKSLPPMVLSSKLLICNSIMRSWSSGLIIFTVLISSLHSFGHLSILLCWKGIINLVHWFFATIKLMIILDLSRYRWSGYLVISSSTNLCFKIIIGYLKQVLNFYTLHFVLFRVSI